MLIHWEINAYRYVIKYRFFLYNWRFEAPPVLVSRGNATCHQFWLTVAVQRSTFSGEPCHCHALLVMAKRIALTLRKFWRLFFITCQLRCTAMCIRFGLYSLRCRGK